MTADMPGRWPAWRSRATATTMTIPQPTWLLTAPSCLLAVLTGILAFHMLHPAAATSAFGQVASVALSYPLHLLVVAAPAAALAVVAWLAAARLAAGLFALVAIVTAALALWPSLAVWDLARRANVSLSLGEYLDNALRFERGGPPRLERSVPYGTAADGEKLQLDVWLADAGASASRPAVVFMHGGGFTAGTRGQFPDWNRWLNRLGYHVFDVEYRLPPPERWKDQVGDVKCALGFVAANAARYGIDPKRIITWGHSAGATLAMLAAYSVDDRQLPPS